jgi:hypothetical protein
MLQRYRLRLGDGTVLQVDKDGLLAWVEDDRRATVQAAGTQQWRPLREFLAEEESAARLARALVHPEPLRGPAPPHRREEPPAAPFVDEPAPALEPAFGQPAVQPLADEPSAPTPPWQVAPEAPGDEGPAIRLKPLADEPHSPTEEPDALEEERPDPYVVPRPRAYDAVERDEADVVRHDRLEGPLLQGLVVLGTVLSRLLDPLTPLVSRWSAPRSSAGAGGRAAVPRVAAVPPRVAAHAPSSRRAAPQSEPLAGSTDLAPSPEPLLPAEPPVSAAPPTHVSVLAEDPRLSPAAPALREEAPVIQLKPLDEGEGLPAKSALERLSDTATEWRASFAAGLAALAGWFAGLASHLHALRERSRRPERAVPMLEPARRVEPALGVQTSSRSSQAPPRAPALGLERAPLEPPTPVAQLPSIRLAEGWEPPEEGDVYEGDEEASSVLPIAWMWTKRAVLAAAVATACVLAALRWDTWFPRAAEFGQTVFTEIDRQARSAESTREHEQAMDDATRMCPHLAPETIRLVLTAGGDGVLEPPDVFQLATEAADRGMGALPDAEAAELRQLQRDLVARLRPPQRARLAEYDRARATRVVFPFENPHALDLVARGAREMAPESRARLQHLLGKAVAAGLGLPASPPPAGSPAVR